MGECSITKSRDDGSDTPFCLFRMKHREEWGG